MKIINDNKILFYGLALFSVILIIDLIIVLILNNGTFSYGLDDPYIHLEIAKNFSNYGIWGITSSKFVSASSSILWVLLLWAANFIFGESDKTPFILNIILSILCLIIIYQIIDKQIANPKHRLFTFLSIIVLTPFVTLIFSGLEHTLQIFADLIFFYYAGLILAGILEKRINYIYLLLMSMFVTISRYEGLFLVLVVCILFFIKKKYLFSVLLGLVSLIPIVIFGIYSMQNGGYFFPNSVLIKGNVLSVDLIAYVLDVVQSFFVRAFRNRHLSVLMIFSLLILIKYFSSWNIFKWKLSNVWKLDIVLSLIFILTSILHLLFARTGWFYRYEAYLITLGILSVSLSIQRYLPELLSISFKNSNLKMKIAIIIVLLSIIIPFGRRLQLTQKDTPIASNNIYEQQYQMALFLKQYYQGANVAANDIGAINYYADINCLDLAGLASNEVLNLIRNNKFNTNNIDELTKNHNTQIAIVYNSWYEQAGGLPKSWHNVGEWTITNNVVCGGVTVSFYAVKPDEKDKLLQNLRNFSKQLPIDVIQSGEYTKQ